MRKIATDQKDSTRQCNCRKQSVCH